MEENDPYYHWFGANMERVLHNVDGFVALFKDYDGYHWKAVDAEYRVMVSVFVVNDDDDHPTVSAELHRPYDIRKVAARSGTQAGQILHLGWVNLTIGGQGFVHQHCG